MTSIWYNWGQWKANVLYASLWMPFNTRAHKKFNEEILTVIKSLDGHYIFSKEDLNKFCTFFNKKIAKNAEWFDSFFKLCEQNAKKVLELENKCDLCKFLQTTIECLSCSKFIELMDYAFINYIKNDTMINAKIITSKILPFKKTLLMQYISELENLNQKDIDKFILKNKWIGTHGFEGTPLNKKNICLVKINKQIRNSGKLNKLNSKILRLGSKIAYYRSNLVETVDKVSFSYWEDFEKLGKQYNMSKNKIFMLTFSEVISLYHDKILPNDYLKRKNKFGIINTSNTIKVVVGKELTKEMKNCLDKEDYSQISKLSGLTANKGKVSGIVRIIKDSKEMKKFREGEILITYETTPDYLPCMKKSKAIVTNQGGISSHAAIVSRELNKPCIIGTKIATKVFKDGDYVEVDANKGIVKKIK